MARRSKRRSKKSRRKTRRLSAKQRRALARRRAKYRKHGKRLRRHHNAATSLFAPLEQRLRDAGWTIVDRPPTRLTSSGKEYYDVHQSRWRAYDANARKRWPDLFDPYR